MAGRRIRTTSPQSLPEMQFSRWTWIPTGKASRSTRRRLSSARFERLSKPCSPFFRFENRRQRHQQHIRDIAEPGSEAGDARVELEFAAGRGGGCSGCHRQHRDEDACERIRFSESIALICGAFRRSAPPSCTHGVGGFERIFHAPTHEDRGEAQAVCESRAARLRGSGDVVCVGTDARAAARRRGGACASCRCGGGARFLRVSDGLAAAYELRAKRMVMEIISASVGVAFPSTHSTLSNETTRAAIENASKTFTSMSPWQRP